MITCVFENGLKTSKRHVCVGAIVVNEKKQVLLVKRAAHLSRPHKYTIPGGFMDRDETLEQAVLRELKEETGYEGDIVSLFRMNDNPQRPKEDRQNLDVLFVVHVIGGKETRNEEVTEITWFDN